MASADRDSRRQRILATVDAIPAGAVAGFGQVAAEAGLPRHARYVGRVLCELGVGSELPWWRVLRSDGAIPERGDGTGMALQRARLEAEGVAFDARGRVRMAAHRWRP